MTDEPLYRIPKEIPPSALATEQKLRQIREQATVSDRLDAYRQLIQRETWERRTA